MANDFSNSTEFIFSDEFIGFTTIPNFIFQCQKLSFKAIGIYCSILKFQNSPNHRVSIKGLMAIHSDGERSVRSGLNELIDAGFLTRKQIRENGQIKGYHYIVHMKPIENTDFQPKRRFADMENADVENVVNKKENRKKENRKKENNSLAEKNREIEKNTNVENIQKGTGLALTKSQKIKVAKWDNERVANAIELFVSHGGNSFAYLQKCYNEPISKDNIPNKPSAHQTTVKSKYDNFTTTYSHNWDIAELEKREAEYIERMYGEN